MFSLVIFSFVLLGVVKMCVVMPSVVKLGITIPCVVSMSVVTQNDAE